MPTGLHERALKHQAQALKLIDRLIKSSRDPGLARYARKMRSKVLLLPMSEVLKRVPGNSLASKARFLGVSKETCHGWNKGAWRPNEKQARKLAKVTGINLAQIRGGQLGEETEK